jgi:O-antigen/teichoic acid export membrane protein
MQETAMPSPETAQDFGKRVKSAVIWRSGTQILSQLLSWGTTLAVIHILNPEDYGLFAMTTVVLAFLTFLSGYGFVSALIQSETVDPNRVRQAFGLLILLNGSLALFQLLVAAPLAATYYREPMVAELLRWQSLIYLSTPFIALPEALMTRELAFRKLAVVNLSTAIFGAVVSLTMALLDYGVWTLVVTPIAMFWVRAIMLVVLTRFRIIPNFDLRGSGDIWKFGLTLLAGHGFWIIQSQSDIFIAGRHFDKHQLGLYSTALYVTLIFSSKFIPPLNEVAFPAYSRLQNDREAMLAGFLKAVRLVMLIACPVYIGMALAAVPFVQIVMGPKWIDATPILQILALAMPALSLHILFGPAFNAIGKPFLTMRGAIFGALLMPLTYLVAVRFGALALAASWLVAMPFLLMFTIMQARTHMGLSLRKLILAVMPGFGTALAMGAVVWSIDYAATQYIWPQMPALVQLLMLAVVGAVAYVTLLRFGARQTFDEVVALVVYRKPPIAV